jgi:hypothetical protein
VKHQEPRTSRTSQTKYSLFCTVLYRWRKCLDCEAKESGSHHFIHRAASYWQLNWQKSKRIKNRKMTMKRKSTFSLCAQQEETGRMTRSRSLLRAKEQKAEQKQLQRQSLPPTLFERILPILLHGGYLYRFECMALACTSLGCNDSWNKNKNKLPSGTNLFVTEFCKSSRWVRDNNLSFELVVSEEFLRHVFDQVNRINVASRPSKRKRAQAQAGLPVWGKDIQFAYVCPFKPSYYFPNGSLYIEFGEVSRGKALAYGDAWRCRLHPNLSISSGLYPRAWGIYDRQPLWP